MRQSCSRAVDWKEYVSAVGTAKRITRTSRRKDTKMVTSILCLRVKQGLTDDSICPEKPNFTILTFDRCHLQAGMCIFFPPENRCDSTFHPNIVRFAISLGLFSCNNIAYPFRIARFVVLATFLERLLSHPISISSNSVTRSLARLLLYRS